MEHTFLDIFQFSIQLKGYTPKRFLELDSLSLLSEFHEAIQDIFELDNDQPYRFYMGALSPSPNWSGFPIISRPNSHLYGLLKTRTLGELDLSPGSILTYIYHPEYKWFFQIKVLSVAKTMGLHQPARTFEI